MIGRWTHAAPFARVVVVLLALSVSNLLAEHGRSADEVLVRGHGIAITRAHLEEEQRCHLREVARMKNEMAPTTVDWRVLRSLINRHALLARATDADREAGWKRFQANLADNKATLRLSDEAFEARLRQRLPLWRLTRARWEERNIENCITQAVLHREVEAGVSAAQIQDYYDRHPERFEQPELVRAQILFLATIDAATGLALAEEENRARRREAEALWRRAKDGEDFAKLVRERSELPPTTGEGGAHAIARGTMAAEIEAAAFDVAPGEVSEIVTSDNGFYIVRATARIAARKLPLMEVRERVRTSVALSVIPAYLEKLKREAGIAILDEALRAEELAGDRNEHSADDRRRGPSSPSSNLRGPAAQP